MTQTRLSDDRYREHIEAESARFADALDRCDGTEAVAACPGWSADDLAAHLRQVQRFWGRIARGRLTDAGDAHALETPERPDDRAELLADGRAASADLVAALADLDVDTPLWSWSDAPGGQTAGFTLRRQAHEALIHRLDAEYACAPDGSARSPIDAMLAADGVDEALTVMYGAHPAWATVTPEEGRVVRLVANDVGLGWLLTPARLTGTGPDGREHDRPTIVVADDPGDGSVRPAAILSGAAEDLDAWLWHRPTLGDLHRTGDTVLLAEVEAVLARPLG